jgi:hypothetical protein
MNPIKTTPKDFFLNLATIVSVYVVAVSLIALLFEVINAAIPDPLSWTDPYSAGLRVAISCLIIAFPLLLALLWIGNKEIVAQPEKADLPIRRWLTYLTLFAAGGAIIIDLVVLLNHFLSGDIPTRFVWKVIVVLIVAGLVFGYYWYSLKRTITAQNMFNKTFAGIVALIIIGSIVGGFTVIGSPVKARLMRFDDRKLNDLSSIQGQITHFWQQKEGLPQSLSDLNDPLINYVVPVNPESKQPYEYKVLTPTSFRLCTEFNFPSDEKRVVRYEGYMSMPYPMDDATFYNWMHKEGYQCFDRTIDPDKFPTFKEQRIMR